MIKDMKSNNKIEKLEYLLKVEMQGISVIVNEWPAI